MLKRGLIVAGMLVLLGSLFGCAKAPTIMRDGPGMVHIPEADMALFGTWTNKDKTVKLVVDGEIPFLTLFVNDEKTFESSAHVDTANGNILVFERDDGEIIPVPYESFRIDQENDLIYGTRGGEGGEEPFHRVNEEE